MNLPTGMSLTSSKSRMSNEAHRICIHKVGRGDPVSLHLSLLRWQHKDYTGRDWPKGKIMEKIRIQYLTAESDAITGVLFNDNMSQLEVSTLGGLKFKFTCRQNSLKSETSLTVRGDGLVLAISVDGNGNKEICPIMGIVDINGNGDELFVHAINNIIMTVEMNQNLGIFVEAYAGENFMFRAWAKCPQRDEAW